MSKMQPLRVPIRCREILKFSRAINERTRIGRYLVWDIQKERIKQEITSVHTPQRISAREF